MPDALALPLPEPVARRRLQLQLNGQPVQVDATAGAMLADVLRDNLGLTGTKLACDQAACGSCTVRLDGRAVFACHTAALQADGASVQTIEGLADASGPLPVLHPLQQAFIDHDALQCGFCTPGLLMALSAVLDDLQQRGEPPTRERLARAIAGNLCRCGAYAAVLDAAMAVALAGSVSPA